MGTAAAVAGAVEISFVHRSIFTNNPNPSFLTPVTSISKFPPRKFSCCTPPYASPLFLFNSNRRASFRFPSVRACCLNDDISNSAGAVRFEGVLARKSISIAAAAIGVLLIFRGQRALAVEGVVSASFGAWERGLLALRSSWPKVLQALTIFREQGLILAALLGLSAFFSMAETSITTLWPWKIVMVYLVGPGESDILFFFRYQIVRELAEKESENGVFKMLRNDVTRFLTTILIGTTVVNIGATALVTEAATAIFGEAGVTAATGVMTNVAISERRHVHLGATLWSTDFIVHSVILNNVAVLLLTEITPKSIAVHNATEVARFVNQIEVSEENYGANLRLTAAFINCSLLPLGQTSGVAFTSTISCRQSRNIFVNGNAEIARFKRKKGTIISSVVLILKLCRRELSGAIEEEEQDMIENVLEIKDTHVREVMTPLVDVVAIDGSATLVDFHNSWVEHQYSRVPVFEERIDNIVGIAYAMDLLDYVQKGELLESSIVGDMAHKPAYFVPDSMSVWNLLREFRIRKVHMAVVLNEYGGTVGIVTLEDVVEEIVGEIFDENDSKEEIQKKTGYVVMRAEGIYDVDANTSIDQLSEDLNINMPEGHHYETVSGFVCEAFGYIPRTGETIKVVLERASQEDHGDHNGTESKHQDETDKTQIFKLEILAGNARKVSAVRFERISTEQASPGAKDVTRRPQIGPISAPFTPKFNSSDDVSDDGERAATSAKFFHVAYAKSSISLRASAKFVHVASVKFVQPSPICRVHLLRPFDQSTKNCFSDLLAGHSVTDEVLAEHAGWKNELLDVDRSTLVGRLEK
ncbi:magnesium and cobalt efflux protein corC [Striga asiatica]|uniref:Magnesium and cobalt efflux protein corC n=1 Tax=Striga asiatica TaxID=4170 RepID=A0A5A7PJ02_STRAF|nr:magnesium and cobalt efflux protein corC [Striga asiatica]